MSPAEIIAGSLPLGLDRKYVAETILTDLDNAGYVMVCRGTAGATEEMPRLINEILSAASRAGLYVGITVRPAASRGHARREA